MYTLGRLMQLLGLLLLPMAIAGNLADEQQLSLKQSLSMSAVGIVIFSVGWLLQQGARPR
jgi:hypothetical protein